MCTTSTKSHWRSTVSWTGSTHHQSISTKSKSSNPHHSTAHQSDQELQLKSYPSQANKIHSSLAKMWPDITYQKCKVTKRETGEIHKSVHIILCCSEIISWKHVQEWPITYRSICCLRRSPSRESESLISLIYIFLYC